MHASYFFLNSELLFSTNFHSLIIVFLFRKITPNMIKSSYLNQNKKKLFYLIGTLKTNFLFFPVVYHVYKINFVNIHKLLVIQKIKSPETLNINSMHFIVQYIYLM